MRIAPSDLTTSARIRWSAVDLFGQQGFGIGLRTIADDAGVSLGLIRHHFGSKDDLRAACDEFVLAAFAEMQEQQSGRDPVTAMLENASRIEEVAPLVGYALAALRDGGPFARRFLDRMVDDAQNYLAKGEANGLIRPSIDARARARYLVLVKMGSLLLDFVTADPAASPVDIWQKHVKRTTLVGLELYTYGLLTDSRMFESYLKYIKDPPADGN